MPRRPDPEEEASRDESRLSRLRRKARTKAKSAKRRAKESDRVQRAKKRVTEGSESDMTPTEAVDAGFDENEDDRGFGVDGGFDIDLGDDQDDDLTDALELEDL